MSPRQLAGRLRSPLFLACACGLALFAVFSWHREHLVPRRADSERARWLLTGDEPGYLLIAQAIAGGEGLNVRPAHERGSYLAFQQRPVISSNDWTWDHYLSLGFRPLIDRSRVWRDHQVLPRPPLFPAVVATYIGRTGRPRWATSLLQALLVSMAAAVCLLACVAAEPTYRLHAVVALLTALGSLPVAYYTTQMFPEIFAGVLLLGALACYTRDTSGSSVAGNLLLVASLWTTPRAAGGVFAASLVLAIRDWRCRQRAAVAALAAGWMLFLAWNLWQWGALMLPNANPNSRNSLAYLPRGTLRFFFGNDIGLLFLGPVFWVGLVSGAVNAVALRRRIDIVWAALFLGMLSVVASFPDSRAGTCPAGRYQVIPAFILAFAPLRMLAAGPLPWRGRLVPLIYVFGVPSLMMSLAVATRPSFWFRKYHPLFGFDFLQPYYALLPPDRWPALIWMSLAWLAVFSLSLVRLRRGRAMMHQVRDP